MTLEQTLVFIDAGYLAKISKYFGKGNYLRVDIAKFAKYLAIKQSLWCKHIFYYTAPPFQSSEPTPTEMKLKAGYDSFIAKLKKAAEVTVREGRLQKICNEFTQKGVDTLLTMDISEYPLDWGIKTVVLLACDTDFVPVLNRIREKHNIKVILYYFTDKKRNSIFSMSNHILTACDVCCPLTEDYFKRNLVEKQK